jgi:hypothetical protein
MSSSRTDQEQNSILFAENLTDTPKLLSTTKIVRKMGMSKWTEVPIYENAKPYTQKIPPDDEKNVSQFTALQEESVKISKKLKLCYAGSTGYTVIATEDLPNNCRLIYAGDVVTYQTKESKLKLKGNPYPILLTDSPHGDNRFVPDEYVHFIDAKSSGNITRFIQYAPTRNQLDQNYIFNSKNDANKVATANLDFRRYFYKNQPFAYMRCIKPIKANDVLVVDYGENYWSLMNIVPELFYKDGTIVSPSCYKVYLAPIITITLKSDIDELATQASRENLEESLKKENFTALAITETSECLVTVPSKDVRHQLDLKPGTSNIIVTGAVFKYFPLSSVSISEALKTLGIRMVKPTDSEKISSGSTSASPRLR